MFSVSLGSSTVQLHDSLGSRRSCACSEAGFSSQNVNRAWDMYYRKAAFCCAFLWAKDSTQRLISCLRCEVLPKEVQPWLQKFHWWRGGWNGGAEVAEMTLERFLCCGFRRTGKAMGQEYQCKWRICREVNVFSKFECHMFYVLYPLLTYLWALPLTFPNYTTRTTSENPNSAASIYNGPQNLTS
jgi:hypothetical protein